MNRKPAPWRSLNNFWFEEKSFWSQKKIKDDSIFVAYPLPDFSFNFCLLLLISWLKLLCLPRKVKYGHILISRCIAPGNNTSNFAKLYTIVKTEAYSKIKIKTFKSHYFVLKVIRLWKENVPKNFSAIFSFKLVYLADLIKSGAAVNHHCN